MPLEVSLLDNIHTFRADMNQPDVEFAAKGYAIYGWDFSSFDLGPFYFLHRPRP